MAEEDTSASPDDIRDALEEGEHDDPDSVADDTEGSEEGHIEGEDERAAAPKKKDDGSAAELAAVKAKAERLEAMIEEMRSKPREPEKDPDELSPEQLQLMDPVERRAYNAERAVKQLSKQMQHHQAHTQDQSEFSSFHSKADSNPVYKNYAEKVENALRALRAKGQNSSREMILRVLLGEDALQEHAKKSAKPAAGAAKSRGSIPTRSDAGVGRSNGKSPEDRLKNMLI